jgi:cyclophilin family peptidyl-prolyl cis-trans isomerase
MVGLGSQRLLLLLSLLVAPAVDALDYSVRFDVAHESGSAGSFTVTVREAKAPLAARRFLEMVNSGFFEGNYFFRVVPGFVVQFGLSGNLTRQQVWDRRGPLRDESSLAEPDWNMRGTIAFANAGPNTRGTQV